MNLLKSTGFLLKSLYLHPFHCLNVRVDFRIFSNLLVSFHAFALSFAKILGKSGMFTKKILAHKMHTVKSRPVKREGLWEKDPEAFIYSMRLKVK